MLPLRKLLTLFAFVCFFAPSNGAMGSCFEQMLSRHFGDPLLRLQVKARDYQRLIDSPLTDLAQANLSTRQALEQMLSLNPAFPKEPFERWLEEHPYTDTELAQARKAGTKNFGELFHAKAMDYEKIHPSINVADFTDEVLAYIKKLDQSCIENEACRNAAVEQFAKTRLKDEYCIMKNPAVLRNLIMTLSFTAVGLVGKQVQAHKEAKDFPYDILATQMIWTPILIEKQCRGLERAKENAGRAIPAADQVMISKPPSHLKQYLTVMSVSPKVDLTLLLFHMGLEKLKGNKVSLDPKEIAKTYATYLAWDALVGAPRSMATFWLYSKKFPQSYRPFLERNLKSNGVEGVYTASDVATRFAIFGGNAYLMSTYLDFVKKVFGAKVDQKTSPAKNQPR